MGTPLGPYLPYGMTQVLKGVPPADTFFSRAVSVTWDDTNFTIGSPLVLYMQHALKQMFARCYPLGLYLPHGLTRILQGVTPAANLS